MPTTEQYLNELLNQQSALATNLTTKGVPATSSETFNSLVPKVLQISGGAYGNTYKVQEKDVNFFDYDGTLLYSYTADEFASLTELPANPSHINDITWGGKTCGLIAQGWNWTLDDAKTYVATNGGLTIGQQYVTDNGKTRLLIRLEDENKSPAMALCVNGTVSIDWGDDTTPTTLTGTSITAVKWTSIHNYAHSGDYVIEIDVTSGTGFSFIGSSTSQIYSCILTAQASYTVNKRNYAYMCATHHIQCGNKVIRFYTSACDHMYNLETLSTSVGIKYFYTYAIRYCLNLSFIVVPSGCTTIYGQTFGNCNALQHIALPKSVTGAIGTYTFSECRALRDLYLPSDVTTAGTNVFYYCLALNKIALAPGVDIGSASFQTCYNIKHIKITGSPTTIGTNAFASCSNLLDINIPSSVTSIEATAFSSNHSLLCIKFESSTPPIASASTSFSNLSENCKILVPAGSLNAYKTATNYPDPTIYTYEEY